MSCGATAVKEASRGRDQLDRGRAIVYLYADRWEVAVSILKSRATRVRLPVLLALVVSWAMPPKSLAQSANERAVRAVVDSFFGAIQRERWDSAAALVDLTRFEPYFKDRVSSARSALPQREMTVEDMMAGDSTMPRAVAEWEIARMNKFRGMQNFGDMSYEFAGVHTQHELFALTIPEAAARWLEAQDERTQMREARRRSGCPLTIGVPEFQEIKHNVLAVALGNDSTAYVVHPTTGFARINTEWRTNASWFCAGAPDVGESRRGSSSFARAIGLL
jgi:hypothetical protein